MATTITRGQLVENSQSSEYALPTYDHTAEQCVLGAIFNRNELLTSIASPLTTEDFGISAHATIFGAMLREHEDGLPFSVVSMASTLERTGELEAIGGRAYLSELVSVADMEQQDEIVKRHVLTIRNYKTRRLMQSNAEALLHAAELPRSDPEALLTIARRTVEQLEERRATQGANEIDKLPDVRTLARPQIEFLVPRLIPRNHIMAVSGPSQSGKTTLLLWVGNLLATGAPFLGGHCEKHPVLYLTREADIDYVADICRRFNITNGPGTNFHIWGNWQPTIAPVPGDPKVINWVKHSTTPSYVIVDSLIAFFTGNNENDPVQMRDFVHRHGHALLRAGACGVCYLCHPGKSETARVYRGSSDLEPAIDTGYTLHNISSTGLLDKLELGPFKIRPKEQLRELLLNYVEGPDGITEIVPVSQAGTTAKSKQKETEEIAKLTKLIHAAPGITQTQLREASGMRKERMLALLGDNLNIHWTVRKEGRSLCYYPHSYCSQ